jgi:hypothetical protein
MLFATNRSKADALKPYFSVSLKCPHRWQSDFQPLMEVTRNYLDVFGNPLKSNWTPSLLIYLGPLPLCPWDQANCDNKEKRTSQQGGTWNPKCLTFASSSPRKGAHATPHDRYCVGY